MSRKLYDDFTKQPVSKMAQSISDMTYSYNEIKVPAKHYKDLLEKDIIELASQDINIEMCLLKPYVDMMNSMSKESRKYFIKALLICELKIKDTANEINALSKLYDSIEDNSLKTVIDKDIQKLYSDLKNNENIVFEMN